MQIDDVEATLPFNGERIHLKMPNVIHLNLVARYLASQEDVPFLRDFNKYRDVRYVLDVGANIGLVSLVFSATWPNATIHSLEPSPLNFEYLEYNLRYVEHSIPEMKGAFDRAGFMGLSLPPPRSWNVNTGQFTLFGEGEDVEIVELGRLDDIAQFPVDFLKLDVEGAEIEALDGASRIIREDRPILMVEFREYNLERAGHTTKELLEHILDKGYRQMPDYRGDAIFVHEDYL